MTESTLESKTDEILSMLKGLACRKCGRRAESVTGDFCENCKNTVTVSTWIEAPSIEPISREKRKQMLQVYAKANGLLSGYEIVSLPKMKYWTKNGKPWPRKKGRG